MGSMEEGIRKYYADKRSEAEELSKALAKAKAEGAPRKEIQRLERSLELARYVGD